MRFLTALLLLGSATSMFAEDDGPPFPAAGRYVGVISVTEKIPMVGFTAVPLEPRPDPRTYVAVKASGRVAVVSSGGLFRIVGKPGTTLLSALDEPTFASLKLVPQYAESTNAFTNFTVEARKGTGFVQIQGNRVIMTFQLLPKHSDFAWNDTEVLGQMTVRLDLTRTGAN